MYLLILTKYPATGGDEVSSERKRGLREAKNQEDTTDVSPWRFIRKNSRIFKTIIFLNASNIYMHKTLLEIHEDVPANHYDKGIKSNLFQRVWHNRRFKEVLREVMPVSGPVLDVGCHGGTFTLKILGKIDSKEIYGFDISKSAIEYAKKKIPYGHFEVADAANIPFKDNFFDAAFCLEVLEHVDDPKAVLIQMKKKLKKGGYGVILVPIEGKLFKTIWFIWTLYYPVWKHAHVQSFQNGTLERMLKDLNFKIKNVKNFNLGMLKLIVFEK